MHHDDSGDRPTDAVPADPDDGVTLDRVIRVALAEFSELGFQETKLETVARSSGMAKRMIHYHFGDKKGLYHRAMVAAIDLLNPLPEDLALDSSVPVEGVRKLVDAIYGRFLHHPEAVRMLLLENLHQVLGIDGMAPLVDASFVSLHLDKLLMLGQDAGAFRPGISADDIFLMISSIAFYRIANRELTVNLFGVDMTSEENTAGIHRFVVDTVLAFLTSNIPDSGHRSYLIPNQTGDEPQSALGIYDANQPDLFGNN